MLNGYLCRYRVCLTHFTQTPAGRPRGRPRRTGSAASSGLPDSRLFPHRVPPDDMIPCRPAELCAFFLAHMGQTDLIRILNGRNSPQGRLLPFD